MAWLDLAAISSARLGWAVRGLAGLDSADLAWLGSSARLDWSFVDLLGLSMFGWAEPGWVRLGSVQLRWFPRVSARLGSAWLVWSWLFWVSLCWAVIGSVRLSLKRICWALRARLTSPKSG